MADPRPQPDFVQVQLTPVGIALAGDHPLYVSNGRNPFRFEAGEPVKVERRFEWREFLANHVTPRGEAIFELVPEPLGPATSAPTVATQETT